MGRTDGRRMRRDDTQHPSLHPLYPGSSSRVDRYRLVGQRPANADRFPEPAGRPLSAGSQFRCGTRSGVVYIRCPVARLGRFPTFAIRRHRRFGLDRDRRHLAGRSHHQPESKEYTGRTDHGSHDRLRSGSHHPDIAVSKFGGTTENVYPVVNGIAQPHHSRTAVYHDTGCVHRSAALRSLHQVTEPALAWRKLRTHDGHEHQTLADACLHLYSTADRNSHRLLRPRRIHRTGSAAHHPAAV